MRLGTAGPARAQGVAPEDCLRAWHRPGWGPPPPALSSSGMCPNTAHLNAGFPGSLRQLLAKGFRACSAMGDLFSQGTGTDVSAGGSPSPGARHGGAQALLDALPLV